MNSAEDGAKTYTKAGLDQRQLEVLMQAGRWLTRQSFYLAGGTALALQLGHRQSVDLDLFSPTLDIPTSRKQLEAALAPVGYTLADSAWGNLVYLIRAYCHGVRFSCLRQFEPEFRLGFDWILPVA